ncbi:MAG: hypothetical protein K0U54_08005 [Bacteroidetes bacterium]|nr:hypothetical protein [Bacteroidota bacterium]
MKRLLLLALIVFNVTSQVAQVGIGTTNPETDLHVAGDMLVQDSFKVGKLNTVSSTDEDFKLLTRLTNSSPVGKVSVLDVNTLSVAPVNTINCHLTNLQLDNVLDLDLQYDTSKYIVAVSNFRYTGDAVEKVDVDGTKKSIGQFVVRTFESAGTWHLEIQNRILDITLSETVEYYVTLVIYDKSYYKNLTPIFTDLGGNLDGTASSVPVLN